ncbi:hypothetical protein VFPPC_06509 [Pochonia chlamydosporia 170]|uniref:Tat pathway signal sequence n=1 Tax=Pochonia chlamydosporia 170 TaxID=1380566 RepID=A0A179FIP7_METCM|nr:hypothetical protein VFPPC_06509 [Pochonia chlamydosporia 170]OAQ65412.1 hypothetical protein VFPPC_06509 [Pochonia chlamydosporia 170]
MSVSPKGMNQSRNKYMRLEAQMAGVDDEAVERRCRYSSSFPWMISTALLFVVCTSLVIEKYSTSFCASNSNYLDAPNDLESAKASVQQISRAFTGNLILNDETGAWSIDKSGNPPPYFEEPSSAVEDAWTELLRGVDIDLAGADARGVANKTYVWPGTQWYRTGLSVYHSLHCVNLVRRALRPEEYPYPEPTAFRNLHVNHCLDYIRQALECAGDITPLRYRWSDSLPGLVVEDSVHTCRNFSKLREWAISKGTFEGNQSVTTHHGGHG